MLLELSEVLDMFEEIKQGHKDNFSWVDKKFIDDMEAYIEKYNDLSMNQMKAIANIYKGGV